MKGLTQVYLVKIFITHNIYLTPQLKQHDEPISAKSAVQILPLKIGIDFRSFELFNHWCV